MSDRSTISRVAKRRGFFFSTASNHGGSSGFYTLGTYGTEMYKNIANSWRQAFVNEHGFEEVRSPTILPQSVFEASGHLDGFDDAMIGCRECKSFHRADKLLEEDGVVGEAEGFSTSKLESYLQDNSIVCPTCSEQFSNPSVEPFNLMFDTTIGPKNSSKGYLRPETAQGTLCDFPTFKGQVRQDYPVGLAQVGRAYRNEISPRKSLIRTREFSQAELQTFTFDDNPPMNRLDVEVTFIDANGRSEKTKLSEYEVLESQWVLYYIGLTSEWLCSLGISSENVRFRQHSEDELAHYAEDCWDAEIQIHDDWVEVAGIAYRSSNDLESHENYTGAEYKEFVEFDNPKTVVETEVDVDMSKIGPMFNEQAQEAEKTLKEMVQKDHSLADSDSIKLKIDGDEYEVDSSVLSIEKVQKNVQGEMKYPEIIEPAFGLERILYAILEQTYTEERVDNEVRRYFSMPASISPVDVLVTMSVAKDELVSYAESVAQDFRDKEFHVEYEYTGSVGKRYRRNDEIGTPYSITIDHQTIEDDKVTIRDRDSMEQIRVPLSQSFNIIERLCDDEPFDIFSERFPSR